MISPCIAPNTAALPQRFDPFTAARPETALATAYASFQQWQQTPPAQRATIVHQAASLLLAHADDYAWLTAREMRRRIGEARGEVRLSADILAYHARQAEAFLAPVHLYPRYGAALLQGSPVGVLFFDEPWHFPFYQLARITGPQLMAGHTVIVKHAGYVPACAIAYAKLWADAGAPAGAYTNLVVSRRCAEPANNGTRLLALPFNGPLTKPPSIAAHPGIPLKKSAWELGGSDAFIVLDDADLDQAVPWAVQGRMYQPGQRSAAAQRFIVVESVADAFLERFKDALKALPIGGPRDKKNAVAPVPTEAVLARLLAQVDAALQEGAAGQALDGGRIKRPGPFMQVLILTDLQPGDPAFHDEFFGPVVSFHRVKDEAAAIVLACGAGAGAGLGGSVWTEDEARGKRVTRAVEAGMASVDRPSPRCWPLPDAVTLDASKPRMLHVLA